jgi:cardiolipin synthase
MRIGNTFGAALTARRQVARTEAVTLLYGAAMALALAAVALKWPRAVAVPLGVIIAWLGLAWVARALKLLRRRPDAGA